MNVISLFFVVLIFLVIQPAVQRRMVESRRLNGIPMPYQSPSALPVGKGQ